MGASCAACIFRASACLGGADPCRPLWPVWSRHVHRRSRGFPFEPRIPFHRIADASPPEPFLAPIEAAQFRPTLIGGWLRRKPPGAVFFFRILLYNSKCAGMRILFLK